MKNTDDLYILTSQCSIPELIEAVKKDGNNLIFTDRAKAIVKEIATYARETGIWESSTELRENFWKNSADATPEQVYGYMLDRIAPTRIHRDSSILLIMPRLDELLNGTEVEA